MIGVFMRYKNGFYFVHLQAQAFHSFLRLPAGNTGVYQYGFCFTANIIAVSIASGIERGDV
jgi:hypothetical protein